jgi:hypothetical protein
VPYWRRLSSAHPERVGSLEKLRGSRVICYFTSDRQGQEAQIGDDVQPFFAQHLGAIGKVPKLDLLIFSRGGQTLTGFALSNAMREFADQVNVLVPFRAHSCATLIALSADSIVAGPFAQLSPIDPSITSPHGPSIKMGGEKKFLPVSVEDVANYFELARTEAGLKDEQIAAVFGYLCERVNPLALGTVYRAREQIGMLATKLLSLHMKDEAKVAKVVKLLTRELLSHDYFIGRREGKDLGLPIVEATDPEAALMWQIYEDVADELKLSEPWNWEKESQGTLPKKVSVARGLLESSGLKHVFSSTYEVKRVAAGGGPGGGGKKGETLQVTGLEDCWKKV